MNGTKSQGGGAGGAMALEARIDRIRQGMATQQARLARGSMLTASIGAILCVAMAIWFSIGYGMLKDMTTPKKIVSAAESIVIESLPEARKALETQINGSANEWAANISQQVQGNIPTVRGHFEEFIVSKADAAMDEAQVITATRFRTFVTQNAVMMSDGFRSLRKPDEAEKFVQDLQTAVQTELGGDIRERSEEMLHVVVDLNAKLEKLKIGEKLNGEQALEREILMITKRLQEDNVAGESTKPAKKSTRKAAQGDPDADATAAPDKADDKPAADDKEKKAEKSEDSGAKPDDADKSAKENPDKKE